MERAEAESGSRGRLTRERVLRTAVALADRDGIESLSMRKLADELGVGAMSLYYHVPNKDELLDAMVDVVFTEIEPPSAHLEWKTAMRRRAISTREALSRHRWAVGLMESRVRPGPANLRLHDAVLGCLRSAGFSVENAIHAYSAQDAYIYGFALQEKSLPFDTAEGHAAMAEAKAQELPDLAEEFPHLAEVVLGHIAQTRYDFGDEFEFGLDLILDALDRLRDTA